MGTRLPVFDLSSLTAAKMLLENMTGGPFATSFHHKKHNDPGWTHLNWTEGEKWINVLDALPDYNISTVCRAACSSLIANNPLLQRLAGTGRAAFVSNLTENEYQVFRIANLLDSYPTMDVVDWWDSISLLKRTQTDGLNLKQGRIAERWTMEMETALLPSLAISTPPVWQALNGDYFGYDILSYRLDMRHQSYPILIEVKSFAIDTNPIIYLTRNEWERALEAQPNYLFFIWCIETKTNRICTVEQIQYYIPEDCDSSKWELLKINLKNEWRG